MYSKIKFSSISLVIAFILFIAGCKKDVEYSNALDPYNYTVPVLTTNSISGISQNGAVSGGRITSDGGATITAKGVCWSTSTNPKVANANTSNGSGTADFTSQITGLNVGTTYFVRAYAVNSAGTGYGSEVSFTTTDSLELGVNYEGGIIFYLDTSGLHGLVCAATDQSTSVKWGCNGTTISGADGTIIGTGLQNTSDILADCDSAGIAAKICSDLVLNGYSDWYLPSKDELNRMYTVLDVNGIGNFGNGPYWSSSEMTATFAWEVVFNGGIIQGTGKNNSNSVRAIRKF